MNTNYLANKPKELIYMVWNAMEDMQNQYPYYYFGWNGFVLLIHSGNK